MKQAEIEKYIDSLGKTNKKLGHAICPFIKTYRSQIKIIKIQKFKDLNRHLDVICGIMHAVGIEATVLHGFRCSYDALYELVDRYNRKFAKNNITVLAMHPNSVGPPLPVEYNYHQPLIIIQRTSTLERARKQLKGSKYYDNYKE